jgi:plasmid stabilization system protein ParE
VKVVWLRRAADNLDAEKAYISQFNPTAPQRIAARIVAAVQLLEHHPEIGRPGRWKARESSSSAGPATLFRTASTAIGSKSSA